MIPKIIHLCWFSNAPYPVEVKVCLNSWKRHLPDYTIRVWNYEDAMAIGSPYIRQALEAKRWAFAADAVRFYAVWKEGGVYMDSDVFLFRRFDEFIPQSGCASFCELPSQGHFGLQAAFFMGEVGNDFCRAMVDYYEARPFVRPDGSRDETISPTIMAQLAHERGMSYEDKEQHLEGLDIYPMRFLSPKKKWKHHKDAFGVHQAHNNWVIKHRSLGRKIERKLCHYGRNIRYALLRR